MHYLFSTFGSAGDVFPMLGLALELQKRGHQVTLATNEYFEELINRHGVAFESLGTRADYIACTQHPDLWHPRRAFAHIIRTIKPVMKRHYEWHLHQARRGPVVGITNCLALGARMAGEKGCLPMFTVHLQPGALWSDIEPPVFAGMSGPRWLKIILFRIGLRFFMDPVICPFLNEWRRDLGLPPMSRILHWWNSPDGILCLFPEWYGPRQSDWPTPLSLTDFPLWNDGSQKPLPDELTAFLNRGAPPVVFTPGTANCQGRAFFVAGVETCRNLGLRGVFLTNYPEQLPDPLPPEILSCRYAPLDVLLPRTRALVHHGGIGSTSQGLLAGVPQVLMPMAHDQFDNVARVTRLGVGQGLPAPRFTGARLSPLLDEILRSEKVQEKCQEIAKRLEPRDGLSRSADVLEKWAEARMGVN